MITTTQPTSKTIAFEDDKLIRFHHCDPAGIIFYPQYFILFNELIEDWFTRGLGISFVDQVTKERVSTPIGRVECDFVAASKIGDVLSFRLAVGRIGTSSIRLIIARRVVKDAIDGDFKAITLYGQLTGFQFFSKSELARRRLEMGRLLDAFLKDADDSK